MAGAVGALQDGFAGGQSATATAINFPPVLDLFGEPVRPVQVRRGRRHVPCPVIAERVTQLRAQGLPIDQVAQLVGLHQNTLYRHYWAALGSASLARLQFADPEEAARYTRLPPGRPAHAPTPLTRWAVRCMVRRALVQAVMAEALHITVPTLLKHYAAELGRSIHVQRKRKDTPDGD